MITIGLDAGHGGSSSGTYSVNTPNDGLFEKDFALDLTKKVNARLVEHGFKTVLTRTTDINPGNVSKRAQICVNAKCDYAVSIHFNGFGSESANGTEVFVPYGETAAGIEAGYKKYLGIFFRERAPFARSNNYYNRNETFDKKLNPVTRRFDAVSDKKDYFGFIRTCWENGVSADLLEVCFLTNPNDFKTYTEKTDEIADAIARSIVEGFKQEWRPKLPEGLLPGQEKPEEEGRFRVITGSYAFRKNAEARQQELKAAGFESWISEE